MADDTDSTETEVGLPHSRISRRTLVKGAAVLGGTVWVAPAIESFVYKAAAGSSPHCPPDGAYGLSGLTIIYQRGGVIYWTFIGENQTSCASGGSIAGESTFTTTCGSNTLAAVSGSPPGVTWNGTAAIDDSACYFAASNRGANLTAAGSTAGVVVLAWIAHDGSFSGQPGALGTPPNHDKYMVTCGSGAPNCASF